MQFLMVTTGSVCMLVVTGILLKWESHCRLQDLVAEAELQFRLQSKAVKWSLNHVNLNQSIFQIIPCIFCG